MTLKKALGRIGSIYVIGTGIVMLIVGAHPATAAIGFGLWMFAQTMDDIE